MTSLPEMIEEFPRRRFLASSFCLGGISLSGCSEPKQRSLNFVNIQPPIERNGEFVISTDVAAYVKNGNQDWATFTNVEVVGYEDSGDVVCRKSVGTLPPGENHRESIKLQCPDLPDLLTFTSAESPCDSNALIPVLEIVNTDGSISYNYLADKNCQDGDLPTDPGN